MCHVCAVSLRPAAVVFAGFAQFAFQDLARRVLRQLRDKMDLARYLMPAEVVAAVLAHLLGEDHHAWEAMLEETYDPIYGTPQ